MTLQEQVEAAMAKIPGVTDIENSESDADPSLDVLIDRDAASALGINLATLGDTLKTLYAGSKSSSWEAPDGNSYDVQLRIPQDAGTAELLKQFNELRADYQKFKGQVEAETVSGERAPHVGAAADVSDF